MSNFLVLVAFLTLVWANPGLAQEPVADPLSQTQLVEALKAGGLSADQMSAIVRRRGLDFEMSGALERTFRDAGADATVVLALWEKEKWNPPMGAALTKDFLMALLQSGTPPQRLSKWIVSRKVNFEVTPRAAEDLKNSGASQEVLGLITTNNVWTPPTKPTYEQVLTNARTALKASNYEVAETEANTAKLMDASRPEAFALIGYVYLYHFNSFPKADSEYRSAVEKGGVVEFRVRHLDHVTKLGKVETCGGQLFLKKGSLDFKSSRMDHNLVLNGNEIVAARLGGPSAKNPLARRGVRLLASHGEGKPAEVVFEAARNKNQRDEERIIADLINLVRQ